jgi:hypothetical protein
MRFTLTEKITGMATASAVLLLNAPAAFAQDLFGEIPETGGNGVDLSTAITNIIQGILMLLGVIAVIVIVIAGLRLVVGGADEGQRTAARDQILWAIVGLIVIVLASAIVKFVETNILT